MIRLLALLALWVSGPAMAQRSSSVKAPANVKVVRPLQLTVLRNMDFGTVILGNLTTSQTIGLSAAGRTCGSGGQVTCTGAFTTAQLRVVGTNNQVVLIRTATPTTMLANASGATLRLTPVLPPSATMPNSGNQGVVFDVGGNLVIPPGTPDGVYSGTIDIQVAYQ